MLLAKIRCNAAIKTIQNSFDYEAESQIWWRLFILKHLGCLDLNKLDAVFNKFKDFYTVPEAMNQEILQLRNEAKENSEVVYRLGQRVEITNNHVGGQQFG